MTDDATTPSTAERQTSTSERRPSPPRRGAGQVTTPRIAGSRRAALPEPHESTPSWLRTLAGWSWRALVILVAVALVFWAVSQVLLLFIALFLAMVFTSVLRPVVGFLSRAMPRGLATALAIILGFLSVAGLLTYVGLSVAGQWANLGDQFNEGISALLDLLKASPLHLTITGEDVQRWLVQAQGWVSQNTSTIASRALTSAGSVVEVFTALALAIFCTVFFLIRGQEMWVWFLNQLPSRMRPGWFTGGGVAWETFSGYTRGIFLVAASDGALAAIALVALGVPLAAPLAVLVFVGAFIPLVGAPLAMVVAMIVALAANGVINAILVGLTIALIGQIEGHLLQPLVMGRQVSLHPVTVALAVTAGTLVAGILGAVISVPLVAVAWAVFSRLRTIEPPTVSLEPPALAEPEEQETA
ncbi:AI-2E family transporter [Actinotalea sp.]|uniref:AI-2E family transporter n=1 Tax=Actinotalea sp. TaxID=1872145 RepID=UPI0035652F52